MSIIDTHCHLDSSCYDDDLAFVIKNAKDEGVNQIIIPGADIKDLAKAREISHKFENIYFASGVHPYHADEFDLEILKEFANDKKCVAIGECGLDYYRLPESGVSEYKNLQKSVFLDQINLAKETKKPLIVHIRDANEDSFSILKENANGLVGGVLHCYNASELLLNLSKFGFYYGIGGVLTFKNAKKLVEILPKIPLDRIILETDAPYLTPEPNRGKRNEPAYTKFVALKMAEILGINIKKIEEITTKNAKELFKI